MISSHAARLEEHPWQSRTLPRRPTRLRAVPPARPRTTGVRTSPWVRMARQVLQKGAVALRIATESLAFLFLLVSLMGGLWAMARL